MPAPAQSRRGAWFALSVLFAINLLNFYDRQIGGAVNEPVAKEWNLSFSQLGNLAMAFTLIYAIVGVPLGRLADRTSRTRILSIGVADPDDTISEIEIARIYAIWAREKKPFG